VLPGQSSVDSAPGHLTMDIHHEMDSDRRAS
jgi:hypothetical protein